MNSLTLEPTQTPATAYAETLPSEGCSKVKQIAGRVFNSTLLWALAGMATLTITSILVISGAISPIPFALVAGALGLAMLIPSLIKFKKLIFETSLVGTIVNYEVKQKPWHHDIITGKLTLGAIPMTNYTPLGDFKDKKISAVITALEPHEWKKPNLFGIPVKGQQWQEAAIEHCLIETPDFVPLSQENIQKGVDFIKAHIQDKEGHVYVHCKAGKGRSATIVICYLLQYGEKHGLPKFTVDEAIRHVKNLRPVIKINPEQRQAIDTFYSLKSTPR